LVCHSAGRTHGGDFENRALVTIFEAMREDATKLLLLLLLLLLLYNINII
jgi:hypothetical protein